MKKKKQVNIGVVGIAGKMGLSIARCILENKNTRLVAGAEHKNHMHLNKDIGELLGSSILGFKITSDKRKFYKNIDLVIEFGLGEATKQYLKEAVRHKVAFLSGSTGIDKNTEKKLKEAGKVIPVFWSPNMSIGANILKEISGEIAYKLPHDFDIDITDLHHKQKKDIPSGTAISIKKNLETLFKKMKVKKLLKIHALRSGDSTGEHSVIFSGIGERIEIKHILTSRNIFSLGAVRIAVWLNNKKKGYYNMQDYLSKGK